MREIRTIVAKDRFQKLFDVSPVPCMIIRCMDEVITAINPMFMKLFGYRSFEIIGKTAVNIGFWGYETQRDILATFRNDGKAEQVEASVFTHRGIERTGLISIDAFNFNDEDYYIVVFNDTTELKTAEKRMLDAIIKAEEKERSRISHELHDGLGPIVSVIKLHLQLLKNSNSNTSKEQIIAYTEKTVEEALIALKEISYQLSPHILLEHGLISAIKSFTDRMAEMNAIAFRITHDFNERFEEIIEVTLYRVLIECINNALKHAKASHIYISLMRIDNTLEVEYSDDGVGFEYAGNMKQNTGLGLRNMQNRIKSIGGSIVIESGLNKGVRISIKILL